MAAGGVAISIGGAAAGSAAVLYGGNIIFSSARNFSSDIKKMNEAEGAANVAKASNLDDIFKNPNLLKNMTPDEVKALANKEGWQVGTLSKGSQAGNGLTIRDGKDRLIQWHPGGGHHGAEPYWKVSSGSTGTQRVGPQFDNPTGGGASR